MKTPTNTLKWHCKRKPTRTTKPLKINRIREKQEGIRQAE
jgi:hypothetical protein